MIAVFFGGMVFGCLFWSWPLWAEAVDKDISEVRIDFGYDGASSFSLGGSFLGRKESGSFGVVGVRLSDFGGDYFFGGGFSSSLLRWECNLGLAAAGAVGDTSGGGVGFMYGLSGRLYPMNPFGFYFSYVHRAQVHFFVRHGWIYEAFELGSSLSLGSTRFSLGYQWLIDRDTLTKEGYVLGVHYCF